MRQQWTRGGLIGLMACLACASAASAQTVSEAARGRFTERAVIGGSTFGTTSPLQIVGLPTKTASETSCLWLDASGNAFTGACLFASTTATISAAWTFSAAGTALAVTNNATVGGTLGVGVAASATAGIYTSTSTMGYGTLSQSSKATGNVFGVYGGATGATAGSNYGVYGEASGGGTNWSVYASGALGVAGNTTLTGDLAVNGGDVTATGALTVRPTGDLTLDPTGDVVVGPDGLDVLPATGYTYNLGALTNKFLTIHAAELWVETLVAQNTIATIGGRVLVGPTTTLGADLASGGTAILVKHNQIANGDRVYLEANGKVEFLAITSGAVGTGPYTYIVTRNLDGSGANEWAAGDAVFNTGTTGSGWIDLYSVASMKPGVTEAGPTIVGNARASATYNDWAPRWAIGNLDDLYGYSATTYGAAFGDSTKTNITIDDTNGFRIRYGATDKVAITTAGALTLSDGSMNLGSATWQNAGAQFQYNGGTPRFYIGDGGVAATDKFLQWDGTNLALNGGYTTIDSTGIALVTVSDAAEYDALSAYKWTGPSGTSGRMGVSGYEATDNTLKNLYLDNLNTATAGAAAHNAYTRIAVEGRTAADATVTSSVAIAATGDPMESGIAMSVSGGLFSMTGGNLKVDTDTLFVDATNNRVGIMDTTPSYVLDVTGDVQITANLGVSAAPNANAGVYFDDAAYTYGLFSTNAKATGSVFGLYGVATGAATTNYGVYGDASGATTNISVYGVGIISGGTVTDRSSRRYKANIRPARINPAILDVQPVMYDVVKDERNAAATNRYGVIAEDLDALGLTELVDYDGEGRPDGVYYGKIAVALIPILKQQQAQIAALTARLAALEARPPR